MFRPPDFQKSRSSDQYFATAYPGSTRSHTDSTIDHHTIKHHIATSPFPPFFLLPPFPSPLPLSISFPPHFTPFPSIFLPFPPLFPFPAPIIRPPRGPGRGTISVTNVRRRWMSKICGYPIFSSSYPGDSSRIAKKYK